MGHVRSLSAVASSGRMGLPENVLFRPGGGTHGTAARGTRDDLPPRPAAARPGPAPVTDPGILVRHAGRAAAHPGAGDTLRAYAEVFTGRERLAALGS